MSTNSTTIQGKTVLLTGANRGIGRALVDEVLSRGASRVYAGTRAPFNHVDERVVPLTLDVTDRAQIRSAVEQVETLDILISNAGVSLGGELDRAVIEQHLAVNLFGTLDVIQAFLPLVIDARGAVVSVLSLAAVAAVPFDPNYSISKGATLSLAQVLRGQLARRGVTVHAVLPGPVDTDMTRHLDLPKTSAEYVAQAIVDGLERGDEEIFPDPMSEAIADGWSGGVVKALEHQFASYIEADPVAS
jgi:NAD(P)-dependent dehydrogenase (short-subunit alcohol dehydrogenase family)